MWHVDHPVDNTQHRCGFLRQRGDCVFRTPKNFKRQCGKKAGGSELSRACAIWQSHVRRFCAARPATMASAMRGVTSTFRLTSRLSRSSAASGSSSSGIALTKPVSIPPASEAGASSISPDRSSGIMAAKCSASVPSSECPTICGLVSFPSIAVPIAEAMVSGSPAPGSSPAAP